METLDKLKITIVILNYKDLASTLECLDSVKRLNKGSITIKVIIVDNGSRDGSVEELSKIKDIDFIQNETNLGYSGGNNIGIKKALARNADYVLILNNDTIVDQDLVLNLIKGAINGDIVSPKIYFAKGFEFHKKRYNNKDLGRVIWFAGGRIDWKNVIGHHIGVDEVDRNQFERPKEIEFATGACMFVKSDVFNKIGLFDEKFFLYLEDMDFCLRAKKAGFKIIFEPKAKLWHKNALSLGGSGSKAQDYYISRNRLLFAVKHASFRTKLAVIRQMLKSINNEQKRKALIDFFTFRFGKGSQEI